MTPDSHRVTVDSAAVEAFRREGYHIHRRLFDPAVAREAREWLRTQDPAALVKSEGEQEPGVPLAVFSVVHIGDHPIARVARDPRLLEIAGALMGDPVYIWASKVNLKAAWCGTAEYYHQDLVYWKDRGYPRDEMLSVMILLDPHTVRNAALHVIPRSHQLGAIEHAPFINVNGLAKFMVPPGTLDRLHAEHGLVAIEGEPGDAVFFHARLVHGSSHNISPHPRMVILSQLNLVGNEPSEAASRARQFNLRRAEFELREAERRHTALKRKYETQVASDAPTFAPPVPERERRRE